MIPTARIQFRADFIFVQITQSIDRLLRWREEIEREGFRGRVYPGVLVLASSRMARRINATLPDVHIPQTLVDKLDDDPEMGVELACEQITAIRDAGAFDGVHLVPVGRYRQMAARLSTL